MTLDAWAERIVPELRGQVALLRRLRPSDVDDRQALGRVAEESRMYGGLLKEDIPMTREQAEVWVAEGADQADVLRWAIEVEGRCVGSCALRGMTELRRYSVGISDPTLWNRGIGTEVTTLVVAWALSQPTIERVELMVLAYNTRAIRAYEKAGFRLREILKENHEMEGCRYDDHMYQIDRAGFGERG